MGPAEGPKRLVGEAVPVGSREEAAGEAAGSQGLGRDGCRGPGGARGFL